MCFVFRYEKIAIDVHVYMYIYFVCDTAFHLQIIEFIL